LGAAEEHRDAGRWAAFHIEIDRVLREVLAARLRRPVSGLRMDELRDLLLQRGLPGEEAGRIIAALESCDLARFAPTTAYPAAATAYEELDRQGLVSADLAFNLGNAYYRQGNLGRAIWAFERAATLDPDDEDTRYNLKQARKLADRRVHDKIEGADRDPLW